MQTSWNGTVLEISVPGTLMGMHPVVLFEHTRSHQMFFTIRKSTGQLVADFTNCSTTTPGSVSDHDYRALDRGQIYQIEIAYCDAACNSATTQKRAPELFLQFRGSSGSHAVEQWRFADANNVALCGITIIVIDEIVGPDASKTHHHPVAPHADNP